jgi:hypothetical protein
MSNDRNRPPRDAPVASGWPPPQYALTATGMA